MDQVATFVDHDVAVVTILDLQDVAHDTICCQTSDEVIASKLVLGRTLATITLQEVLVKVYLECFAKLISAVRIWDYLDDTSESFIGSCSVADTSVRSNIQV